MTKEFPSDISSCMQMVVSKIWMHHFQENKFQWRVNLWELSDNYLRFSTFSLLLKNTKTLKQSRSNHCKVQFLWPRDCDRSIEARAETINYPFNTCQYTYRLIKEYIPPISLELPSDKLVVNSLRKEIRSDLLLIYFT